MDNIKDLYNLVTAANRISVAIHTHPDGDAVGSGLALVGYLRELHGKDAVLVVPDCIPDSLRFILNGFPENSVIICDDGTGVEERIASSDLLFCLDCSSFSRTNPKIEASLKSSPVPKVLIDHHLNPDAEAFSLVFSQTMTSSTCELLFGILKEMPDVSGDLTKLPRPVLEALMTGMTTDTNNFANSVFPGTMVMASELIAAGVDRDRILSDLYNNYRENRLRLMGYLLKDNMEITPEGASIMILDKAAQEKFDFRQGDSEGFVNLPLAVDRVGISVFLTEEEGRFRVSVRSKRGISANMFASKYFHGGGHEMAAGGRLYFPEDIPSPEGAKAYILKVTREFFAK
ncbi:MAG: bifunctional oligoribonuclease/PAP phosphatase NrnA [Bacteroidales bacterium]|nr:bifunctional oligoribonuclease/PAP phosphatase NrnA [Bacteroidales bacterium]